MNKSCVSCQSLSSFPTLWQHDTGLLTLKCLGEGSTEETLGVMCSKVQKSKTQGEQEGGSEHVVNAADAIIFLKSGLARAQGLAARLAAPFAATAVLLAKEIKKIAITKP